jgi:hypothetical protein
LNWMGLVNEALGGDDLDDEKPFNPELNHVVQ